MKNNWVRSSISLMFLSAVAPAVADDRDTPPTIPSYSLPASNWTGFYIGGLVGYGTGNYGPGTTPVFDQGVIFPSSITGLIGGVQAGYNYQLPNNVVLGVETDMSFPSPPKGPAAGSFSTSIDYIGTARGRVGYAYGAVLPFVTGGLAWGRTRVGVNDADGISTASKSLTHVGWTAGAGVEFPISGQWTGKFEYDYIDLGSNTSGVTVDPTVNLFKLGLNLRLGDPLRSQAAGEPAFAWPPLSGSNTRNIHGQTTIIEQGYPSFRSPYQGANSLPGSGRARDTVTATAFLGVRIWDGGEVYLNPELAQGFGLGSTLGLGGFSNGEAQKSGAETPRLRAQRYFFRQTFGLGGEQETVEDGPNQLAGTRDINRVTLTVGRIAIGDIFDNNSYAHDPRVDFMNWALWSSAAYDFPADLPGFTRGAVAELNQKDWALRAGLFQVPDGPNSDVLKFKTVGVIVELEERYNIGKQAGILRLGSFANRGLTGNYRNALGIAAADPTININSAILSNREDRLKYGFYANAEQAITDDIGVFARVSWNDGQNEILSFTDIDRSVSGGFSIKGTAWWRPNDKVGLGGAVNGLSAPHRAFLAAGGLGLLIGDGALKYRTEEILETYYALNLAKNTTLTTDYQYITNPAYNGERGPISIFGVRVHSEF